MTVKRTSKKTPVVTLRPKMKRRHRLSCSLSTAALSHPDPLGDAPWQPYDDALSAIFFLAHPELPTVSFDHLARKIQGIGWQVRCVILIISKHLAATIADDELQTPFTSTRCSDSHSAIGWRELDSGLQKPRQCPAHGCPIYGGAQQAAARDLQFDSLLTGEPGGIGSSATYNRGNTDWLSFHREVAIPTSGPG